MKPLRAIVPVFLLVAAFVPQLSAKDQDWKDALKQQLQEIYPLTKTGIRYDSTYGNMFEIKEFGALLILQQSGIIVTGKSAVASDNVIENGKIVPPKGAKGFLGAVEDTEGEQTLDSGRVLYTDKIDVKDTEVRFHVFYLFDTNANRGTVVGPHFEGAIHFKFAPEYLKAAKIADVKAAIDAFFQPEQR
jgi:hypothetical protein